MSGPWSRRDFGSRCGNFLIRSWRSRWSLGGTTSFEDCHRRQRRCRRPSLFNIDSRDFTSVTTGVETYYGVVNPGVYLGHKYKGGHLPRDRSTESYKNFTKSENRREVFSSLWPSVLGERTTLLNKRPSYIPNTETSLGRTLDSTLHGFRSPRTRERKVRSVTTDLLHWRRRDRFVGLGTPSKFPSRWGLESPSTQEGEFELRRRRTIGSPYYLYCGSQDVPHPVLLGIRLKGSLMNVPRLFHPVVSSVSSQSSSWTDSVTTVTPSVLCKV